ncbi:MAG: hypothetical protein LC667_16105 [Thioalkalivibrio sp.]|nr:hypothetical protein [Thioalkalivibrio sp.]
MKNSPVRSGWVAAAGIAVAASLAGCGDSLGVDGPQNVMVAFQTVEAPTTASQMGPAGAPVQYDGTNGTLVIDQILMIVSAIELEHEDGCDDDTGVNGEVFEDCEDFEADPQLIDLPLDGAPLAVASALIAPGVYDELEFLIEDIDLDDLGDDEEKRVVLEALRDEVRSLVPDWPEKASLLVIGTFQAPGEEPVAFRTFVEAEVKVELDLLPNLIIGNDGSANRSVVVDLRPDLWFTDNQGGVRDLTQWDYDSTGLLLELNVEIEAGFWSVEFDD